ncbi:MAG: hypothetical protein ACPGJS_15110, partial [Flammeovirgaceae bacterium]
MQLTKVESTEEVRKLLTKISTQYFKLSILCMENEEVCQMFKENPIPFLTSGCEIGYLKWEGCGMVIPDKTQVTFNKESMWPTLCIETEDKNLKAVIEVHPLQLNASIQEDGEIALKGREFFQWSKIEAIIEESLTDPKYEIKLEMPWFV